MPTKTDRITSLARFAEERDKAAKAKADNERMEAERLLCTALSYGERISALLDVMNFALANDIKPTKTDAMRAGYGDGNINFIADGFYHWLGFNRETKDNHVSALAIYAGGACGPWDFFISEDTAFLRYEDRVHPKVDKDPVHMAPKLKQFIKDFPAFEAAFYKWVDTLTGKE